MNLFEKHNFPKYDDNKNLDLWIKENKQKIFNLKNETRLPWSKLSKKLTEFLGSSDYIRPSVLTEKLVFELFLTKRKFEKKIKI